MANIKSAKKDIKRTKKVTLNNHELKARVKNDIKKCEKAIISGDKKVADEAFKNVQKTIDKALAKECDAVAEVCIGNVNMLKGELPI